MLNRRNAIKFSASAAATTFVAGCGLSDSSRSDSLTAVVIGAGIAGLSAAYDLKQGGFDVQVFEKWDFVGGRMRNAQMGPLHVSPHAIGVLKADNEMFALADKVGIRDQLDGTEESDAYPLENGTGEYFTALQFNADRIAKIPGLSASLIAKIPLLLSDAAEINANVNPFLGASAAAWDNESIEQYYLRKLGIAEGREFLDNYMAPVLAAWGWKAHETSRMAIQPYIYLGNPTVVPKGGIGVLTRKLAELVPVRTNTSVRYVSAQNSSGKHTIRYCGPDMVERDVTPDVVVVATEGKFIPELVRGLNDDQQNFFRSIDFTVGCGVSYILPRELAPKQVLGTGYTPSHPDPVKRRISYWTVAPSGLGHPDNPPTATIYVSREESIAWQSSNQSQPDYCLPFLKHVCPQLDTSKFVDAVTLGCSDLVQMPTGYLRSMASILKKQEIGRKGIYFAGEYMSGAHTGAACASGRSVAANILSHWI